MRDAMDFGALEVFMDVMGGGDPHTAIERQEARGQRQVAALSQLPVDAPWDHLAKLGVEKLDDGDGVLCRAKLPEGWKIAPTDHSMWSHLVDDKGRQRAAMFYKAAFYDRSAHLNLTRRYNSQVRPVGGWGNDSKEFEGVILDGEQIIYRHPQVVTQPAYDQKDEYRKYLDTKDVMENELRTELIKRYPEYENPLAYWD